MASESEDNSKELMPKIKLEKDAATPKHPQNHNLADFYTVWGMSPKDLERKLSVMPQPLDYSKKPCSLKKDGFPQGNDKEPLSSTITPPRSKEGSTSNSDSPNDSCDGDCQPHETAITSTHFMRDGESGYTNGLQTAHLPGLQDEVYPEHPFKTSETLDETGRTSRLLWFRRRAFEKVGKLIEENKKSQVCAASNPNAYPFCTTGLFKPMGGITEASTDRLNGFGIEPRTSPQPAFRRVSNEPPDVSRSDPYDSVSQQEQSTFRRRSTEDHLSDVHRLYSKKNVILQPTIDNIVKHLQGSSASHSHSLTRRSPPSTFQQLSGNENLSYGYNGYGPNHQFPASQRAFQPYNGSNVSLFTPGFNPSRMQIACPPVSNFQPASAMSGPFSNFGIRPPENPVPNYASLYSYPPGTLHQPHPPFEGNNRHLLSHEQQGQKKQRPFKSIDVKSLLTLSDSPADVSGVNARRSPRMPSASSSLECNGKRACGSSPTQNNSDDQGQENGFSCNSNDSLPRDASAEPQRKKIRRIPSEEKDEKYLEKRRKNNLAAKKSRDERRKKEDKLAISYVKVKTHNTRLLGMIDSLTNTIAEREMYHNRILATLLAFRESLSESVRERFEEAFRPFLPEPIEPDE